MDVTFLGDGGKVFSIEVGFFDSFLEVKDKIKKYQGIPVNMQTLFFNDKLLKDDEIVSNTNLIQGSCILIELAQDKLINVKLIGVVFPKYLSLQYDEQVWMDETIMQLKERIHKKYNYFKINDMVVMFLSSSTPGGPVLDHQSLREYCGVSDNETVCVFTKKQNQQESVPESTTSRRSKILNLNVIPLALWVQIGMEMKLKVQIDSCAKVSELKNVLEYKYKCFVREDGCHFFMHDLQVMCENESFELNQVHDGDNILLCDGYV